MKTRLDCLPCLLRQALYAVRLISDDENIRQDLLMEGLSIVQSVDFHRSPPENAMALYGMLAEKSGVFDLFARKKAQSNWMALSMKDALAAKIAHAADPLLAALSFAIAGNVIDYGAHQDFDVEKSLGNCLSQPLAIDDYQLLQKDLDSTESILYLADNCGELVFDGLLIERLNRNVTLAVKEKPVINDATLHDAAECGLNTICSVISNGTACPGTPIETCSSEFKKKFQSAGLIISKGQGNFETLSETTAPIYFLLTVKCAVVAKHIRELTGIAIKTGAHVLLRNRLWP